MMSDILEKFTFIAKTQYMWKSVYLNIATMMTVICIETSTSYCRALVNVTVFSEAENGTLTD